MLVSNINKAEHIKVNCSYAKCNNVAIFLLGKKSVSIHNGLDLKEMLAKFGVRKPHAEIRSARPPKAAPENLNS